MILPNIIMFLFGSAILIYGFIKLRSNLRLKKYGEIIDGKILDSEYNMVGDSGFFFPIISFELPDKTVITKKLKSGTSKSYYSKGRIVEIIYDLKNPQNCNINSFSLLILRPSLITLFGTIIVFIAVLVAMGIIPPESIFKDYN